MGLDMYLHAELFIYFNSDLEKKINEVVKDMNIPGLGDMNVKRIQCEAIYWRKANAIHSWFVTNVQNGNDDCGHYHVELNKLAELSILCRQALADKKNAERILMPQDGFFFGSTKIDEYYFQDLEHTASSIEKILARSGIDQWDFKYHSSW